MRDIKRESSDGIKSKAAPLKEWLRPLGGRLLMKPFGALMCVLMVMVGGCGQPTETGQAYYNPTWGADGKIYAIKEVIKTYRQGGLSPSTSQQRESYLVVMNGDGSNEQEIKFVGVERYPKLNASPLGHYLAMDRDGVEIMDIHDGYKHIHTIDVDSTFFDWSPDEGELVFQTSNGVELYTRAGLKVRDITNLRLVYAWKYAANIIGDYGDHPNIKFRLVSNTDNVIYDDISVSIGGQYFPNGETIFGSIVGAYAKVSLFDFSIIETYPTLNTELLKEPSVYNVQVNPVDDGEVMFSGGAVSTLSFANQGIYLINLDGSNKRTLRR